MKKKAMVVAWGYLGSVIGAGFASGQELVQFFVGYGSAGFWGTILAGCLFAIFGGLLLFWANVHYLDNYQAVLRNLFGRRCATIIDALLALFLFLGICIMLAASGAIFYEHINQSKATGIMLAYLGVLIFLFTGRKGMVDSYNLLVPIKFLLLLTIVGYTVLRGVDINPLDTMPLQLVKTGVGNWFVASVLYVAYNFTLAMVVLVEYQPITRPQDGIKGAFLGGLMLGLVALVCYGALLPGIPTVAQYEIPMLFMIGTVSLRAKAVYVVVLWLGILTTAIANSYGFAQRFSEFSGLRYKWSLILTLTMALPLAFQSFAFLVATVYPLLGLLGIVILVALTFKSIKGVFKSLSIRYSGIAARLFKGV